MPDLDDINDAKIRLAAAEAGYMIVSQDEMPKDIYSKARYYQWCKDHYDQEEIAWNIFVLAIENAYEAGAIG